MSAIYINFIITQTTDILLNAMQNANYLVFSLRLREELVIFNI